MICENNFHHVFPAKNLTCVLELCNYNLRFKTDIFNLNYNHHQLQSKYYFLPATTFLLFHKRLSALNRAFMGKK